MLKKLQVNILVIIVLLFCFSCAKNKSDGVFKVVDGKEIFMNGDSQIIDKLVTYEGEQYYISEEGTKVKNNWAVIDNDGQYAYFGAKGIMIKDDIREINNQLYIFDKEGRLENSGLVTIDGFDYYATKDGYLLRNQFKLIDDKDYFFDKEGKHGVLIATTSWVSNENSNGLGDYASGYYCLDKDGQIIKNQWIDNYYLTDSGLMATNTWIGEGENRIYVGADGKKQTDYKETVNLLKDILGISESKTYQASTNKSVWQLKYYVDEFEEYTDEKYLTAEFEGKFDNIVYSGQKCDFLFLIDDLVSVKMWEYGSYPVNKENQNYNVSLRTGNGEVFDFTGYMISDRVTFDNVGSNYVITCLKGDLPIKIILEEISSNSYIKPNKYLVEVVPGNFVDVYWK